MQRSEIHELPLVFSPLSPVSVVLHFSPRFFFYSSAENNPSSFPYLHGWVEARVEQGFVFNDVADSRHDGLVQENVAEHPATLAPQRILAAGEAELWGAHVQTLHGPDLLLAILRQPAGKDTAAVFTPGQLELHWGYAFMNCLRLFIISQRNIDEIFRKDKWLCLAFERLIRTNAEQRRQRFSCNSRPCRLQNQPNVGQSH